MTVLFSYHALLKAHKIMYAKRGSGGILIFIRKEIYKHVELVNLSDEDDRQWLMKGQSVLNYMGILRYIPPLRSTGEVQLSNKWNLLAEEVALFCPKGHVLIAGDFNARIPHCNVRISKDQKINDFGTNLLDICSCNNLNGRVGMDSSNGCFSCITTQGCRVVDYIIVSTSMLKMVKGFQANDPSPMSIIV